MDRSCPPNHALRSLPRPRPFIVRLSRPRGRCECSVRADRGCVVRLVGLRQEWCVNASSCTNSSLTRICNLHQDGTVVGGRTSSTGHRAQHRRRHALSSPAPQRTSRPSCVATRFYTPRSLISAFLSQLRIVNETQAPFAVCDPRPSGARPRALVFLFSC